MAQYPESRHAEPRTHGKDCCCTLCNEYTTRPRFDWWIIKQPGQPNIYWQHQPGVDAHPNYEAREILGKALLISRINLRRLEKNEVPPLKLAGKTSRGIEFYIEASL